MVGALKVDVDGWRVCCLKEIHFKARCFRTRGDFVDNQRLEVEAGPSEVKIGVRTQFPAFPAQSLDFGPCDMERNRFDEETRHVKTRN